jgi:O-antigen ligase
MQTTHRSAAIVGIFFIILFLVYTPGYPDPSMAVKWLVVSLGGAIMTLALRKELRALPWAWLGILLWLGYQFSLLTGVVNPVESQSMLWKYTGVSMTGMVLAAWWHNKNIDLGRLSRWMSWGLIIILISALYQVLKYGLEGHFFKNLYRIQGLGGHKNMLTMLLFTGSAFFAFSARHDSSGIQRKIFLLAALLAVVCTIILRTRSIWIALVVSGSIVILLYWLRSKKKSKRIPSFLLISFISMPLLLGALYFLNVNEAADATNLSHRKAFWNKSIQMWSENPAGVGAGMWKIHLPAQGLEGVNHAVEQGKTQLLRPHNDYLWVLTESGTVGAIGFWGFILLTLFFAVKGLSSKKDQKAFDFHLAMIFAFTGYLVFSFFDFPMERPEHFLIFFFISGYFLRESPGISLNTKGVNVIAGIILVILLFSAYVGRHRLSGDAQLNEVIAAHGSRNANKMVNAVDNCMNDYYNMDRVANSLYYYRGLGYFAQKQLVKAYNDFELGLELTPYNIPTLNQMGNWHKMCNDNLSEKERNTLINSIPALSPNDNLLKLAESFYLRALDISPHYTEALLNMAELKLRENNFHEALSYINYVYSTDYENPKFLKAVKIAIGMWSQASPEEQRRPGMKAYFRQHDPRFEQIEQTYINFRRKVKQ